MVKSIKKRKVSLRYICSLVAFLISFTAFFLVLVLHYRIFDKYETSEIVKINGITDPNVKFYSGKLEITLIVDDEEYITYFQERVTTTLKRTFRVGDKIQYLSGNPDKIFPERIKGIIILSCTEAVIVAVFIGATIYEVKKGL